jgi:RNA polymerase sigma-70 factor (ECF subfamily)
MNDSDLPNVASRKAVPAAASTKAPQPREAVLCAEDHGAPVAASTTPDATASRRAELIARAQRGDRKAMDALLLDARPRALAVALKVLRNPDDAEDAVQDAFLKAWRNLFRFEGRSSFSTWIHRIVMNASLDLLRRQACRPGVNEDEPATNEETAEPSWEDTPERAVAAAETRQIVHGALEVLSPVHRLAVTLRELEDRSYEEIARASSCPVGTVMSRLHHARRKLADELRARLPEAPALCAA